MYNVCEISLWKVEVILNKTQNVCLGREKEFTDSLELGTKICNTNRIFYLAVVKLS